MFAFHREFAYSRWSVSRLSFNRTPLLFLPRLLELHVTSGRVSIDRARRLISECVLILCLFRSLFLLLVSLQNLVLRVVIIVYQILRPKIILLIAVQVLVREGS